MRGPASREMLLSWFTRPRAETLFIDQPIDSTDKSGATYDITQRDRDEVMDDPADCDERSVEVRGGLAGFRQHPRQR
jgi:hypothetical protein